MTENDTRLHKGGPPEGNTNAQTHGIHTFERKGPAALSPFELDSLEELRQALATAPGRKDLKVEIIARLTIIARKFFSDGMNRWNDPRFWDSGPMARGGTYLAELRRWVESMPADDPEVLDAIEIVKQYRSDDPALPQEGGEDAPNC
jgi:hypothetical protein